jgi:hypothetical protein
MLTAERVRELFDYDPLVGDLVNRTSEPGRRRVGSVAGTPTNDGHLRVKVDGRNYLVHVIVWLHQKGVWPERDIDHSDRDGMNNRINNLRPASHRENEANKGVRKNNTTGFPGVVLLPSGNYFARTPDGNRRSLLTSPCAYLCYAAYAMAQTLIFGDYAPSSTIDFIDDTL